MLRLLFNEPRREDTGKLLKASIVIKETISLLETRGKVSSPSQSPKDQLKARRLALWSRGFIDALNELEQSQYCCQRYASEVHKSYVEEMNTEELDHYHRFVYFYKNAFIRVFSILDKLGYFMNDLYDLRTEKIKPRFSYFTVLRRMHDIHHHQTLEQRLYDLKVEYKVPLAHLREHRNTEIHYINVEMIDDLGQDPLLGNRIHVENVAKHVKDLQDGFDMVCRSLETAFTYISAGLRKG
jgi:hypothetical protein